MAGKTNPKKGGGNNKKGGGNNRRTQRSQQFNKLAANNIALQDQSQADMLGTLNQQSQADLQRRMNSAQSIYGGGLDELRNTTPTDYDSIRGQMNNALTGLAPNFGGQAYQAPGEAEAGNALGLAFGEAGNTMLSNMAAREGQHQGSSERQMGLMGTYAQDRVHQDQDDQLQQYRNQLQNLRANDPYQIQNEATRLEDQAMSNRLGMSQIRSDREFSKYLQDMLGNQLNDTNNRNPARNNGPNNQNNGPRTPPTPPPGPGTSDMGTQYGGGAIGPGGIPTGATQTQQRNVPPSWWAADTWNELPQVVRNVYDRPAGTSAQVAFRNSAHPSFNNFEDFSRAYRDFREIINKLYARGNFDPSQGPFGQGGG